MNSKPQPAPIREPESDVDLLGDPIEVDSRRIGVLLGPSNKHAGDRRVTEEAPANGAVFCILAGSTNTSAKLDPEDCHDLVGTYLHEASCRKWLRRRCEKLCDRMMVPFGYPKAQKNDVERALGVAPTISRALDIPYAKYGARTLPALSARSSFVIVDQTGEMLGDATNAAARMRVAAEPDMPYVTESEQRISAAMLPHNHLRRSLNIPARNAEHSVRPCRALRPSGDLVNF